MLKVSTIQGSIEKLRVMINGTLKSYNTISGEIAANNFVQFTDSNKTNIKLSSTKIDGLLVTEASQTKKGKVWILT